MPFCMECGTKLPDGAKFCHECGKAVVTPADNSTEKITKTESDGKKTQTDKASIIVKRLANAETRSQSCFVYLDNSNNPVLLNNGSEHRFSVSPGYHVVTIKHDGALVKKQQVFASVGEIQNVSFMLEEQSGRSNPSAAPVPSKNETGVNAVKCPQCGGDVSFQTVTESSGLGCGSFIGVTLVSLLLWLFISAIIGVIAFVIGMILVVKGSNETVTYAVCQKCGHRFRR